MLLQAYYILDEFLLGGEIQESSKKNVLKAIASHDILDEVYVFMCMSCQILGCYHWLVCFIQLHHQIFTSIPGSMVLHICPFTDLILTVLKHEQACSILYELACFCFFSFCNWSSTLVTSITLLNFQQFTHMSVCLENL